MIDPRDFTNEMENYWSEKLGNVSSEALRKVWFQLADVFGRYGIGKPIETSGLFYSHRQDRGKLMLKKIDCLW